MNTLRTLAFASALLIATMMQAQNTSDGALGLPGDNLNLYATMKLFQESETLEAFERKLNDEESRVNNLDLDGDERIDYIQVVDEPSGDVHIIILRIDINPKESQDVAVFTVWKDNNGQVQIQLTGDEALYGKDYIIEPNSGSAVAGGETPNPGYTRKQVVVETRTEIVVSEPVIEISAWPIVSYIFLPSYVYWHSPWYYGYYPSWWRPWTPYYWHYYHGYHSNYDYYYHGYYRQWHHHRHNHWNEHYYGHRRSSEVVYAKRQSGFYRSTYSKPESRREGHELYTRTHKDQPRRTHTGGTISPNSRPTTNNNVSRPSTRPTGGGSTERPSTNRPINVEERNRPADRPTERPSTNRPINVEERNRPADRPTERPSTNRPTKVEERNRPTDRPIERPSTNRPTNVEERNKTRTNQEVNRPSQRNDNYKPAPRNEQRNERSTSSPSRPQNQKSESKSTKGEGKRK